MRASSAGSTSVGVAGAAAGAGAKGVTGAALGVGVLGATTTPRTATVVVVVGGSVVDVVVVLDELVLDELVLDELLLEELLLEELLLEEDDDVHSGPATEKRLWRLALAVTADAVPPPGTTPGNVITNVSPTFGAGVSHL